MRIRRSGFLLHISSLPSPYGIGDLGPRAYQFADFLVEAGQSLWQILPLNPTCLEHGNSPYNSYSAFAGNPLLISPELLVQQGFLKKFEIKGHPPFLHGHIDYKAVTSYKRNILKKAFYRHKDVLDKDEEFANFYAGNKDWLDDYALFMALRQHFDGKVWSQWPPELRDRKKGALREWRKKLTTPILMEISSQFLFFKQWAQFKEYCNSNNIQIIGDIPIYVHYDSSDVWSHPDLFKLNRRKKPTVVAGVPPDYFSATGQLWGNPVYNWDVLRKSHYSWWIKRIEHNLRLFDITRIDHFRGFVGYWEVPSHHKTALRGRWIEAPARDFLGTLLRHFPSLPIIAEDLGVITPDVREIMNYFGFPGMRLLLFAFSDDRPDHPYLPHTFPENCLVYTGTHDNNTTLGWFRKDARPDDKKRVEDYIGHRVSEKNIHWELIRLAMSSVAQTAIIPMQDLLGLGEDARMNHPSTTKGNWEWRLKTQQLTGSLAKRFFKMTEIYGRT